MLNYRNEIWLSIHFYISNYGNVTDTLIKNNIIILNFEVKDLSSEYERLKSLNIGEVSQMMYVNIHLPYWYFNNRP